MRIDYRVAINDLAYRLLCECKPGEKVPTVKSRQQLLNDYKRWMMLWGEEWIENVAQHYDSEEELETALNAAKMEVLKKFPEFADTHPISNVTNEGD